MSAATLPQLGQEAAQALRQRNLNFLAAAVDRLAADNTRMHQALTRIAGTATVALDDEHADRQYALSDIRDLAEKALS